MEQSNINPPSLKELIATPTTSKHPPAVGRTQQKHEVSTENQVCLVAIGLAELPKAAHEAAGPPTARHPQQEKSPTLHNESSEKTPVSQVILGVVTDLPIDIINEISCRTTGSTKSTEITEHTIPEKHR